VVPPKPQGVVGVVAIVAPIAEDDAVVLRTRYDVARDNRQCTCHFLKLLLVKPLRQLARGLNIETRFVDGEARAQENCEAITFVVIVWTLSNC
jgi:hypothetical protein